MQKQDARSACVQLSVTTARLHTDQEAGSKQRCLEDNGPAHAIEVADWMMLAGTAAAVSLH